MPCPLDHETLSTLDFGNLDHKYRKYIGLRRKAITLYFWVLSVSYSTPSIARNSVSKAFLAAGMLSSNASYAALMVLTFSSSNCGL